MSSVQTVYKAKAGGSKLSDVENEAKFRILLPLPVKIRGEVGEISGSINEGSPTTKRSVDLYI